MEVILSGMNVDMEILKKYYLLAQKIKDLAVEKNEQERLYSASRKDIIDNLSSEIDFLAEQLPDYFPTPETISAASARVSRSEKTLPELRAETIKDVEGARKSNTAIVFGLGHESVAEHAYFNFDLLGVSRAVVNWVEEQRLASFTEKSMRYVLFTNDFFIPPEIQASKFYEPFKKLAGENFKLYLETYNLILPKVMSEHPNLVDQKKNHEKVFKRAEAKNKLEGMAKEDARYCLPYATKTQLELSVNGRSLERMIRVLNSAPSEEARGVAKGLLQAQQYAPSLIKYPEPTKYLTDTRSNLESYVGELAKRADNMKNTQFMELDDVRLLDYDPLQDEKVILALFTANSDVPYHAWHNLYPHLSENEKQTIIKKSFVDMQKWDPVFREFEIVDLLYEVEISEAAYAQLKRQRMMTLFKQPETDKTTGLIVPENVMAIGKSKAYQESFYKSLGLYEKMLPELGRHVALYAKSLSSITRAYFKVNLRELHSMARHREDKFAQWEIRQMQKTADDLAKQVYPLSTQLLCGKDVYDQKYAEVMHEVQQ